MNSIMKEYYPAFEMYQALRFKLLGLLTDADLSYNPGGSNKTLGALCREIGDVQHAYIESFRTFTIDFSYRSEDSSVEGSIQKLREWYTRLDNEMKEVVSGLSEEVVAQQLVDRGSDFKLPIKINLTIYTEALLLFYGRADIYLKAMQKSIPKEWSGWLG